MRVDAVERVAPAVLVAVAVVATAVLLRVASPILALTAWPAVAASHLVLGRYGTRAITGAMENCPSGVGSETVTRRVAALVAATGAPRPAVRVVGLDAPVVVVRGVSSPELLVSDALVDHLDDDALDAVLAHELGHLRSRTLPKLALSRVAVDVAGLAAFLVLVAASGLSTGNGFVLGGYAVLWLGATVGAVLPTGLYLLASAGIPVVLLPAHRALARREEFAADRIAAAAVGSEPLRRGLSKVDPAGDDPRGGVTGLRIERTTVSDDGWLGRLFAGYPPFEARRRRLGEREDTETEP